MVAAPHRHLELLRRSAPDAGSVQWFDMAALGRNPARIISAIHDFVAQHEDRPVRMVGEPIWPGRSAPEMVEATRHEALINLAFAQRDVSILCPYDTALDSRTLTDSHCTHPELVADGSVAASGRYAAKSVDEVGNDPLSAAPAGADSVAQAADLRQLRSWLRPRLGALLSSARSMDMLVAVNEAAANSLRHAGQPGAVRLWSEGTATVCQISDPGHVRDPLAGRLRPPATAENGRGLWLINQLCDLSQLRSGPSGTTLRLHMGQE
jgi:anti-sigma regulatory factor (Ser/Thr protein kinase)